MKTKKQLYESIISSIAKQVKKTLNESQTGNHEFSKKDLQEIQDYMLNDDDFYEEFCRHANFDYYDSYEQSVIDLIYFLENDVYDGVEPEEAHAFYILDEPDYGSSYMTLKSGKIVNLDNIWSEYSSMIKG